MSFPGGLGVGGSGISRIMASPGNTSGVTCGSRTEMALYAFGRKLSLGGDAVVVQMD